MHINYLQHSSVEQWKPVLKLEYLARSDIQQLGSILEAYPCLVTASGWRSVYAEDTCLLPVSIWKKNYLEQLQ